LKQFIKIFFFKRKRWFQILFRKFCWCC